MSATLLEQPRTEMSVIFPTKPATVKLHPLPKNAEAITYRVEDNIILSAWMPDGYHTVQEQYEMTDDDFYHENCEGCERNCYSFLNQYTDEETDEVDWDQVPGGYYGHCNVYDEGYCGQDCPEGHVKKDSNLEFDISNMVFEISLTHLGDSARFTPVADSAYLAAGVFTNDNVKSTETRMPANVFGSEDNPEGICWGYNSKPHTLREIVTEYYNTPFNNDLTPIECFEENCRSIRSMKNRHDFCSTDDNYLCQGADQLIMVDAEKNKTAFFHLLTAGYKSLSKAPHIMILPVKESTIHKNGNVFEGYLTDEDSVGKQWFITTDGLLIGQV